MKNLILFTFSILLIISCGSDENKEKKKNLSTKGQKKSQRKFQ